MSSSGQRVKIGIIGGTGLDNPDLLENRVEKYVDTPYGKPSDALIIGQIKGVDCVILARHGRGHHLYPSNINFCANLWALKAEGCTCIIATNACGSLKEEIPPGHVVICDQFLDWTRQRRLTFYDGSEGQPSQGVCHIPMAEPFCSEIRKVLIEAVIQSGGRCHEAGTIVVVEGPRFSTRAESRLFQSFGASVIGMTTVPEVTMAHELGLPYANMSLVTDYDCWKEDEAVTTVDGVDACMKKNAELAKNTLLTAIPLIAQINWDPICSHWQEVARNAVMK
jgi:5'-methylthioadenosine phosphorylase